MIVQDAGKLHDENAVGDHDSRHHNHSHERHDVECAPRYQKSNNHSGEARGDGHEDDERINERSELRHENQVNHEHSYDQTKAKLKKCMIHVDHCPA